MLLFAFIGNPIVIIIFVIVTLVLFIEVSRFILKPQILISHKITRETITTPGSNEEKKVFCIKVVNKSSFFKMTDLYAALYFEQPMKVSDGSILKIRLKLLRDKILYLNQYKRNDKRASYALYFTCLDDIDNLWISGSEASLTFKVIVKHGFSGKTSIVSRKYYYPEAALLDGTFKHGKSLDVSYN